MPRHHSQPGPLAARLAELRAMEERWYKRLPKQGRGFGASPWEDPANQRLLEEIDDRYGVLPHDPRVYSIAAYRAEERELDQEWEQLRRGKGRRWSDEESWEHEVHFAARRADCRARHFPGVVTGGVDTLPKLWAWISFTCRAQVEGQVAALAGQPTTASDPWNKIIHAVYDRLHELRVPWAPPQPYPKFSRQRGVAELDRIANQLESEEPAQAASGGARCPIRVDHKKVLVNDQHVPLNATAERTDDIIAFVSDLVEHYRDWRSSTDIGKATGREGVRFDRVFRSLPLPIKSHITSDRRKGFRLA